MSTSTDEPISSIKDPRIVEARRLSSAAGRSEGRKFLLEGLMGVC
jgi:hypothetical protein